jgi:hypothetical protein
LLFTITAFQFRKTKARLVGGEGWKMRVGSSYQRRPHIWSIVQLWSGKYSILFVLSRGFSCAGNHVRKIFYPFCVVSGFYLRRESCQENILSFLCCFGVLLAPGIMSGKYSILFVLSRGFTCAGNHVRKIFYPFCVVSGFYLRRESCQENILPFLCCLGFLHLRRKSYLEICAVLNDFLKSIRPVIYVSIGSHAFFVLTYSAIPISGKNNQSYDKQKITNDISVWKQRGEIENCCRCKTSVLKYNELDFIEQSAY